jgi:hypothetical protein
MERESKPEGYTKISRKSQVLFPENPTSIDPIVKMEDDMTVSTSYEREMEMEMEMV